MDYHKLNKWDNIVKFFPYILFTVLSIVCINHCFFFDTIQLSSLHAFWYYDNDFQYFLLPNDLDSGHPPLNGMMLAALWKIFGKSLWVGHAFIFIWTLIMIYQLQKICLNLFSKEVAFYVSLAVLADATFLTQSVLVSPDIILMASFFTAIRGILENRKTLLMTGILFTSLISVRGMMCTAALFFFYSYYQYKSNRLSFSLKSLFSLSLPFLPGVLLAFAFLGYHYYKVGWIGYHPDMPWGDCFQKISSMKEFFINVATMGWRFFDSGRIIIWLLLSYSILLLLKKKDRKSGFSFKEIDFMILFGILFLISSYSFLLHTLLSASRYLFPHFALIAIIAFLLLNKIYSAKKIRIIAVITSLVLISGNFIKYPENISTSWDSTLSHLPFYELREQMFEYIQEENIPFEEISSGFCFYGNQHKIDLSSPSDRVIKNLSFIDETDYFIYSNISNLRDDIIDKVKDEDAYTLIKKLEKGNIFVSLYKRNTDL